MKALPFVLSAALVFGAMGAEVHAQRVEAQPLQIRPGLVQAGQALLAPEAIEKLKFNDEQKEKYGKIEADYKEKAQAAQQKFREDLKGLNDRTKFKEVLEQFQSDSKKAREDGLAKVEKLLTDDQKTVFAQVKNLQPGPGIIRPGIIGGGVAQILPPGVQQRLQLTDEQKKQIEAIQKDAEAKLMKVLTEEQKKQLEQFKGKIIINPRKLNPAEPGPAVQPRRPANPQPAIEPRKQ